MEKPFNVKRFLLIILPLQFLALAYITYSHYQRNYQVCELHDIAEIDSTTLYKFYKIDSLDLYTRDIKLDTVTVYNDSGKYFLQITIACPITSQKHTKVTSFYTAEDIWMMSQNEDYSYVENFGPTYAWFGFSFESEIDKDELSLNSKKVKEDIINGAMAAYSKMVVSDTNKYFTREKDEYLSGIYNKIIKDTNGVNPIVLRFTYNPYEESPPPFTILSLFK